MALEDVWVGARERDVTRKQLCFRVQGKVFARLRVAGRYGGSVIEIAIPGPTHLPALALIVRNLIEIHRALFGERVLDDLSLFLNWNIAFVYRLSVMPESNGSADQR